MEILLTFSTLKEACLMLGLCVHGVGMGIKPRASYMLGKCSTSVLCLHPSGVTFEQSYEAGRLWTRNNEAYSKDDPVAFPSVAGSDENNYSSLRCWRGKGQRWKPRSGIHLPLEICNSYHFWPCFCWGKRNEPCPCRRVQPSQLQMWNVKIMQTTPYISLYFFGDNCFSNFIELENHLELLNIDCWSQVFWFERSGLGD